MFTVDSVQWQYPVDVIRNADIRSSDVSGTMMNGRYYNDVIGTYMSFTVKIAVPINMISRYYLLYGVLVNPKPYHTFLLPYNESEIEINGRIENVSDIYVRMNNGTQYWKGIQFTVVSNVPSFTIQGTDVISWGLSPIPSSTNASEGDTMVYHNGAWVSST